MNITEKLLIKHAERKLNKLNINLVHFIPGRIRLQSAIWIQNKRLIDSITSRLKSEVLVYDAVFTSATGSLLITYNASYMTNTKKIEEWFLLIQKIYAEEYGF
ncbi:HMA2 domain-containing protein [Priestia flexa]|uniref:HMA2 domain-containing protein n=1 Tax=Priestia flexa TaxID=86664 RepID=UPI001B3339CD|nr:metal ABC transporter ATPase [Priestia flexa]